MAKFLNEAIAILGKGNRINQADVDRMVELQTNCPPDEFYAFSDIWEGLSLIINAPDYNGGAVMPDVEINRVVGIGDIPQDWDYEFL